MTITSIQIWGDSLLKGVFYDEARHRYAIVRDNAVRMIEKALNVPLINRSAMGRTAPQALDELRAEDAPLTGALVLIELGGNDCDLNWAEVSDRPQEDHGPATPVADYEKALLDMAGLVRERGGLPVISTLPPLHPQRYLDWVSRGLSRDSILRFLGGSSQRIYRWQELYSAVAQRAAVASGSLLFPLREYFLERLVGQQVHCVDGIHLSAEGHRMVAEAALKAIGRQMPQLLSGEGLG